MEDKKIVLFLGAGASVPYKKPTTKEFKTKLMTKYRYDDVAKTSKEEYYLDSILNFPNFQDIEDVLQCVKEIEDFFSKNQYGGKFLLKREPQLIFNDPGRQWPLQVLIENIKKIRTKIEDDVFSNYSWNNSDDNALEKILGKLFKIFENQNQIRIFTTNYDRSVEEYCSDPNRRLRCIDGFRRDEFNNRRIWDGNFEYPIEENLVNVSLYKLHGSLNWKRHQKYGIEATSEETRSPDLNYIENLLVYPTVSPKDGEEKEPYKTIRKCFENSMNIAHACVVIGFSFRDEHINRIFDSFVSNNKKLIVISGSAFLDLYNNLLKKDPTQYDEDKKEIRNIDVYYENKKNIIAINSNITIDNIEDILNAINMVIKD